MQDATECERLTKEPTSIGTRDRTDVAAKFYLKTRIIGVRLNFRVAGPVASVKNNVNKQQLATWEHLNGGKQANRSTNGYLSHKPLIPATSEKSQAGNKMAVKGRPLEETPLATANKYNFTPSYILEEWTEVSLHWNGVIWTRLWLKTDQPLLTAQLVRRLDYALNYTDWSSHHESDDGTQPQPRTSLWNNLHGTMRQYLRTYNIVIYLGYKAIAGLEPIKAAKYPYVRRACMKRLMTVDEAKEVCKIRVVAIGGPLSLPIPMGDRHEVINLLTATLRDI
uniref:SFRICE_002950 n=1 Tax=Spodoptera frugiperda TaxID=7108 RepID=A0A2H1V235_SPOFR